MLETVSIRKVFNQGKPGEFTALDEVSLTMELRGVSVLKGPSGSGKTTLLNILGCMTRPTTGRLFLKGREMTSLPERFMTQVRQHTFGFIFQSFNLIRGISILENVMVPAYPTGERHISLKKRAMGLLEQFGLESRAETRIEWLSGGEAQRVAIARALINDPAIIIADEPTAHLDTKLSHDFMAIMERLSGTGKTVIIASHDPIVYSAPFVSRIIEMRDGRLVSPEITP